MSQTPEHTTETSSHAAVPPPVAAAPQATPTARLYQAAAWVAIVAGVLFIIALALFIGLAIVRYTSIGGNQQDTPGMVEFQFDMSDSGAPMQGGADCCGNGPGSTAVPASSGCCGG